MRVRSALVAMVCLDLFVCRLAAQQPVATGVPQAAVATVKTNTNLVLVDVVVTANGAPVHGLSATQMKVLEAGHEQKITSFEEHVGAAQHVAGAATAFQVVQHAPLPPNTYSDELEYVPSNAANVLLLDALNTPVADQMQVRRQMLDYLGKMQPGARIAVFTLASRLRMVQDFTMDAGVLAKAISGAAATPKSSALLDAQDAQSLGSALADLTSMGASSDAVNSLQQFAADEASFQVDLRVRMTMDAMQQLARYLSAVPGRKNLIWFSGSFPLSLDPDDSLLSPFSPLRNYSEELKETSELLSASRVAVYPIDARGLMGLPSSNASYKPSSGSSLMGSGSGGGGGGRGRGRTRGMSSASAGSSMSPAAKDDQKFLSQLITEHAAMHQIAEDTGGAAFVDTNGLSDAAAKAMANGDSYYTIGYAPANTNFDGRYRKIEVRVPGTKYQLAYRRGYYARSTNVVAPAKAPSGSVIAAAAAHAGLTASQIKFKVRLLPADDPLLKNAKQQAGGSAGEMSASLKGPVKRYVLDFAVDMHDLQVSEGDDGVAKGQIEFVAIAYDAAGKRLNYVDRGVAYKLQPQQLQAGLRTGFPWHIELDLPAGKESVRVAVHDPVTDRIGSVEIPVVVSAVE